MKNKTKIILWALSFFFNLQSANAVSLSGHVDLLQIQEQGSFAGSLPFGENHDFSIAAKERKFQADLEPLQASVTDPAPASANRQKIGQGVSGGYFSTWPETVADNKSEGESSTQEFSNENETNTENSAPAPAASDQDVTANATGSTSVSKSSNTGSRSETHARISSTAVKEVTTKSKATGSNTPIFNKNKGEADQSSTVAPKAAPVFENPEIATTLQEIPQQADLANMNSHREKSTSLIEKMKNISQSFSKKLLAPTAKVLENKISAKVSKWEAEHLPSSLSAGFFSSFLGGNFLNTKFDRVHEIWYFLCGFFAVVLLLKFFQRKMSRRFFMSAVWKFATVNLVVTFLFFAAAGVSKAVRTVPHVIGYQGFVTDKIGQPVETPLTFRFSLWSSANFVSLNKDGSLRDDHENFSGFVEVQNISPQDGGNFQTAVGIVTPLPDLDWAVHKFLQVEVKPIGAADNQFKLLDIDGIDNESDLSLLAASPFAINADKIDNRDVGVNPGDLPALNETGKLPTATIPGEIAANNFTIGASDLAGDIRLQFGNVLNKAFKWAAGLTRFELGDSLFVWGNLANSGDAFLGDSPDDLTTVAGDLQVQGKINGRDISQDGAKLDALEDNFLEAGNISLLPRSPLDNERKMVAHWNFDNNFLDVSKGQNHGVERGDVKFYSNGKFAQALNLDGVDDHIYLDDLTTGANESFDGEVEKRSVSLWYWAYETDATQMLFEEGGATNGLNIFIAENKIWAGAWAETNGFPGVWLYSATQRHKWHHVALVFDWKHSGKMRLFHDGVLVQEATVPTAIAPHTGDDAIGAVVNDSKIRGKDVSAQEKYFFKGFVDDGKVFDRALGANEIANEFDRENATVTGVAATNVLDAIVELAAKILPDADRNKLKSVEQDATADQSANEVPFADRLDLVARWNFDENLWDQSDSQHHGVASEGVDFLPGKSGTAVSFEESERIYFAPSDDFEFGTGNFSILLWANFETEPISYSHILSSYSPGWIVSTDSKGDMAFYDSSAWRSTQVNIDPGWHFWTIVREGDDLNFYLDGTLREIISGFSKSVVGQGQLQAGRSSRWGSYFQNYQLDEAAIYRRALSAQEVQAEFQSGTGVSAQGIGENARLRAKNVEDAILELKVRLAALQPNSNQNAPGQDYSQDIAALNAKIEVLQQEFASLSQDDFAENFTELSAKLTALESQLATLQSANGDSDQASTDAIAQINAKIASLESQLASEGENESEKDLQKLEKEIEKLQKNFEEQEKNFIDLQKEKDDGRKELQKLQEEFATQEKTISALQKAVDDLEKSNSKENWESVIEDFIDKNWHNGWFKW